MSLRKLKTLYCLSVMAVGVILTAIGGMLGWLVAVIILSSALPAWKLVVRSASESAIIGFYRNLAGEATHRTVPIHQASEDR